MRPLLSTLCEHMALQLADPAIMDEMRVAPDQAHLRAHFILNEAQRAVSAFCRIALSTATKNAAMSATVPTPTYDVAITLVLSFRAEVMGLFRQDLSRKIVPLTYAAELPPDPVVQPTRRNDGSSAWLPPAKRSRGREEPAHNLTEAQYASSMATGFLVAHGARADNIAYARKWPWHPHSGNGVCAFHAVRGFVCFCGVCGTIDGQCSGRHCTWSDLSPDNCAKITRFADESNGLMTLSVD